MPLRCQRELFDLPSEITFLNAAYWTPLARPVRDAGRAGIDRKAKPWEILPEHYFQGTSELREAADQLFGAGAESIAIIPSTSYGNAIAARNLPLRGDARILLVEDQFPSSYYTWARAAQEANAEVHIIDRPAVPSSWSQAVSDAIDDQTAIVAVPQVHWSDGSVFDLLAISERCREVGAALVLDLTQSLGILPFSIAEVDPDFVVAATYKWLLGPYSLSLLYAAPRHHDGEPVEQTWMVREGAEDFANLAHYRDEIYPDARRYDVGETSNFVLVPMATEALRLMSGWGVTAIHAYVRELGASIRSGALDLGFEVSQSAPHIIGLELPTTMASTGTREALVETLAKKKVYVSLRGNTIRVSPHVYNDSSDVQRLLSALKTV